MDRTRSELLAYFVSQDQDPEWINASLDHLEKAMGKSSSYIYGRVMIRTKKSDGKIWIENVMVGLKREEKPPKESLFGWLKSLLISPDKEPIERSGRSNHRLSHRLVLRGQEVEVINRYKGFCRFL